MSEQDKKKGPSFEIPVYLVEIIKEKRQLSLCILILIFQTILNIYLVSKVTERPIYNIPGAPEGVYYPLRYKGEIIANFAERVAYLAMNYNPASVEKVLNEALEVFTPELAAKASSDFRKKINFVKKNDVSQSFYPTSTKITETKQNYVHVVVTGNYAVYISGGIVRQGETKIHIDVVKCRVTSATPMGLCVNSFYEQQ